MEEYKVVTRSVEETKALAERLALILEKGDVISLTGDLGAGKTAFVQGLAEGLGVERRVTSPTFPIIKEYSGRIPLYHFDVYRLTSPAELVDLGYEEYFYDDGACVLEWGDRVSELFPPDYLEVLFERAGEDMREIAFIPRGDRWEERMRDLFGRLRGAIGA
ncbi:MAG: tRNA (adenosine(37)-N6)-threonylcarbamoyltransferase complex ATPase subunit type 1 TsaE [Chloroflexi bacterium]|nr:tRNA (adenosine(37)-N6)-threonylcarbamoyltransferase complex ATPase subunit type 1 TsaE [Chloroflexota bacterium]